MRSGRNEVQKRKAEWCFIVGCTLSSAVPSLTRTFPAPSSSYVGRRTCSVRSSELEMGYEITSKRRWPRRSSNANPTPTLRFALHGSAGLVDRAALLDVFLQRGVVLRTRVIQLLLTLRLQKPSAVRRNTIGRGTRCKINEAM